MAIQKQTVAMDNSMSREKNYWLNKLSDLAENNCFPYDREGAGSGALDQSYSFEFSAELSAKLLKISNNSDQNLLLVLILGTGVLLHKYNGVNNPLILSPIFKQDREEDYLNTMLLYKLQLETNPTYKEALISLKREMQEAIEHINYPLVRLPFLLNGEQTESKIFDTAVLLENIQDADYIKEGEPKILFSYKRKQEQIEGTIHYQSDTYDENTIHNIADRLCLLFHKFLSDFNLKIQALDLLTNEERNHILNVFNQTDAELPDEQSFIKGFEETIKNNPNQIAVSYNELTITYEALDKKANQLGRTLINSYGVLPKTVVALMIEPSIERMIAMLAILKAGAAFLPIDTEFPDDRINFMLEDSGASVVITQDKWMDKSLNCNHIIPIDGCGYEGEETHSIDLEYENEDPMYIIYTSGSTGEPKGVMITNENVFHYVTWMKRHFDIKESDCTMLTSSFAFDLGYTVVFSAIQSGAKLYMLDKDSYYDIGKLLNLIEKNRITYIKLTPSLFSLIVQHPGLTAEKMKWMRYIILGGEKMVWKDVESFHKAVPHVQIVNHYGPTEGTIGCITHNLDFTDSSRYKSHSIIGTPIDNMKAFVLDRNFLLLPPGFPGELVISGKGLTKGYINNSPFNQRKFISHPWEDNGIMYRTGDLVCMREDGTLEFLGRIDNQLKVRGYRVEPDEVRRVIGEMNEIEDSVVVPIYEQEKATGLGVYYVLKESVAEFDDSAIKMYLSDRLPSYMVANKYMRIKQIPLTKNGKTDYRALPAFTHKKKGAGTNQLLNDTEQKLLKIWEEVLDQDDIGIDENFFDLGGHSILVIQSINRIQQELNYNINLPDFFAHPTIRELAQIEEQANAGLQIPQITKRSQKDRYPISPIQYPEWYLQKMNPNSTFYNQNYMVELRGVLNVPAFLTAVNALIERHDVFRTSLVELDGKPYQILHDQITPVGLDDIIDIRQSEQKELEINKIVEMYYDKVFNFAEVPIFKIKLIRVEDERAVLIFTTHHIVWDQISSFCFFDELSLCYNSVCEGKEIHLPSLELNYIDYTEWLNELVEGNYLEHQRKYWLEKFATVPEPLDFTTDRKRPPIQAFKGVRSIKELSGNTCGAVKEFCKKHNITKQIFFLSVLNLLIYRYTGQDDFVVGTPIANRDTKELEGIIGLFAAALPIRCKVEAQASFMDLIDETRAVSVEAYDNHLYPFNKVLEELKLNTDFSRSKVISVFFGVQNDETELYEIELDGLKTMPYGMEYENYTTAFDFTLQVNHSSSYINLSLRYDTDIFTGETGERFFDKYVSLLEQCITNPEQNINEYQMTDEKDEEIIYNTVNRTEEYEIPDIGVMEFIEKNFASFGQHIALEEKDKKLSYDALKKESGQIANYLTKTGVQKGDKIGLFMPSGFEMIIGIMGILKTGAAYVPLSIEYSNARIEEILELSQSTLIVSMAGYGNMELRKNPKYQWIHYDSELERIKQQPVEFKAIPIHSEDLAYIIFTSGSTGKPKGIGIKNKGLINLLHSVQSFYKLGSKDAVLFHTPIIFDASVLDVFLPLYSGSKIVVLEDKKRKNILNIAQYIDRYHITFIQFVPLMLDSLLQIYETDKSLRNGSLSYVIVGGSVLNRGLRDKFERLMDAKLINHYGPTEITVDAAFYDCSNPTEADIVPIGRPISNTKMYILDSERKLCPAGVPGELYLSSVGAISEYLGGAASDSDKFIKNNFNDGMSSKLFRTGDRGIYTEEGYITVLGRVDNQVKVNGNRVELEEVEIQLLTNEHVRNASVILEKGSGDTDQLTGFVELEAEVNRIAVDELSQLRLYTLDQNYALKKEMDLLHYESWPRYFAGSMVLQVYWNKLYQVFPQYQIALLNEGSEVTAIGNAIPIFWDGTEEQLPAGWDGTVQKGFSDYESGIAPNTLVMIAVAVNKKFRGMKLSKRLIDSFKAIAGDSGFEHLMVILRPIGKSSYKELSLKKYGELRNEKGEYMDKWLKLHVAEGSEVLKYEPDSQLVSGTREQWEEWTKQSIADSDELYLNHTLQKAEYKGDEIHYYDPGIWLRHNIPTTSTGYTKISESDIKKYLGRLIPAYMVPNNIVFLNRIPLLPSGKNDVKALNRVKQTNGREEMIPPQNEQQMELFQIFKELVGSDDFGIHNSFYDIGGHSITSLLLLSRIEQLTGIKVPVVELLKNPTIYDLEHYINSIRTKQWEAKS